MPRRVQLFLAPVTAGVLVLVVILTLNWLLLPRDRAVYRERAAEAIEGQVLAQRSYLPSTEAQPPRYGQNDCLILAMLATEPPGTRWQAAVSPVHPVVQVPEEYRSVGYDALRTGAITPVPKTELCWQLLVALQPPSRQVAFYHHYVHGYLTGTAALLKVMSLKQASALLHGLAVALPALVLLMALGDRKEEQGRRVFFASVSAAVLLLSGSTRSGWNLDLAWAEMLLSSFLLASWLRPLPALSSTKLVWTAAIFGALCMAFEFLTALLPSALILMLGLLALDPAGERDGRFGKGVLAVVSFTVAVVAIFAGKLGLVAISFPNDDLSRSTATLNFHMGAAAWTINPAAASALARVGVSSEAIQSSRVLSAGFALAKMLYFSDLSAFGSRVLGLIVMLGGLAGLPSFALWRLWKPGANGNRSASLLLLGAAAVPSTWLLLFVEHSITNANFMHRMLPWLTIIIVGALALEGYKRPTAGRRDA